MKDEKSNPLLDKDFKKEIEFLDEEYKIFNNSIEKINKDLETKRTEDQSTLTGIMVKLQNIKTHMEKINNKILYLKNFMKDDSTYTFAFFSQIKKISENISSKYEAVNKKFTEKIDLARRRIQVEIDERTNHPVDSQTQSTLIMKKLDSKMRMDVDRLKERQHALEQIAKISNQLMKLSQDMRLEAVKQGRVVNSIENHIVVSNIMTGEANEQLNRRSTTQTFNIKFYFWICSMLCLVLMMVIFYIYWKFWRSRPYSIDETII